MRHAETLISITRKGAMKDKYTALVIEYLNIRCIDRYEEIFDNSRVSHYAPPYSFGSVSEPLKLVAESAWQVVNTNFPALFILAIRGSVSKYELGVFLLIKESTHIIYGIRQLITQ